MRDTAVQLTHSMLNLQAKSQLARSMKIAVAVVNVFDAADTPTAVQGRKAATNTFGATVSSLSGTAGESARAFSLQPTAKTAVCVCCL